MQTSSPPTGTPLVQLAATLQRPLMALFQLFVHDADNGAAAPAGVGAAVAGRARRPEIATRAPTVTVPRTERLRGMDCVLSRRGQGPTAVGRERSSHGSEHSRG